MAVRRRLGRRLGRGGSTGAAAVVDDDLPPEFHSEPLRHAAPDNEREP
jgi:hypothetical protein